MLLVFGKLHVARYVAVWDLPRAAQRASMLRGLDDTVTDMVPDWF